MRLLGRDHEFAALLAALAQARTGVGQVVLISGEPGIGKSSLAEAFGQEASEQGATVLWGTGWDDRGTPAYWPWIQVLRGATKLGSAVEGALEPMAHGSLPPERFSVFEHVWAVLEEVAEDAPLVVVLENLHSAGESSILLLEFLATQLRRAGVVVVATYRSTEVAFDPALATAVERLEPAAVMLRPQRFSEVEVASLLDEAGLPAGPDLVSTVLERSQGNPLFASHLVAGLTRSGVTPEESVMPAGLSQAMRRLAEHVASSTSWPGCLRVAAVLGADLEVSLLAGLLDAPVPEMLVILDRAVEEGLLRRDTWDPDRFDFSHALVREALYDSMSSAERAELHLRAAETLRGLDAAPARLAHHFAAAWPAGGAQESAELNRTAGDDAMAALAYEDAARSYEAALLSLSRSAESQPQDRCEVLLSLAAALSRAGNLDQARRAAEHAADLAERVNEPHLRSRAALQVSEHLEFNAVDRQAIAQLERAEAAWDGAADPMRAKVLAKLALAKTHADRRDAADHAALAVRVAEGCDDPAALAVALSAQLHVHWGEHDPDDALKSAERIAGLAGHAGDPGLLVDATMWRLTFGLELGDLAAATAAVEELERLAAELRLPTIRHLALSRRATLNALHGRVTEALHQASEARDLARRCRLPDADAVYWCLPFALWRQDEIPDAEAAEVERIARHLTEHSPLREAHEVAVVALLADRGELAEATERFESVMAALPHLRHDMVYLWTVTLLASDCVALGTSSHAAVLRDALLPFVDRWAVASGGVACLGSVRHELGLLAGMLGHTAEAREHLIAAAESHAGCPTLQARSEGALEQLGATWSELTLARDGAVFVLRLGDRVHHLPPSLGLTYLTELIRHPGQEIEANRLVALGTPDQRKTTASTDDLTEGARADPLADRAALAAYRRRLAEYEEDIATARDWNDDEKAASLAVERDFLLEELSRTVGLGGRSRRFSDEDERARLNATRAIRSAIKRLGRIDPEAANLLEDRVSTGSRCRYSAEASP